MSVHFPFVNYEVDPFRENLHVYGKRCSSYIKLSQIFTRYLLAIYYYMQYYQRSLLCAYHFKGHNFEVSLSNPISSHFGILIRRR